MLSRPASRVAETMISDCLTWLAVLFVVGGLGAGTVERAAGQQPAWHDFEEALAVADSTGRFVMVAVYAPWCGWCHKMKDDVYSSTEVRQCLAKNFVTTRLNRDDTDTVYQYQGRRLTPRKLAATFRAEGVPTTVLLSPRRGYVMHLSGFIGPTRLRSLLAYVSTRAYRSVPYEEFRPGAMNCDDRLRRRPD
ncbi:thioredoxin family protein [Salinibacter ruber]|uniref:thioredoxin family protein n=1 Tax=Salinibacter ruber TaxID=146919 RepID=UPI000E5792B5